MEGEKPCWFCAGLAHHRHAGGWQRRHITDVPVYAPLPPNVAAIARPLTQPEELRLRLKAKRRRHYLAHRDAILARKTAVRRAQAAQLRAAMQGVAS